MSFIMDYDSLRRALKTNLTKAGVRAHDDDDDNGFVHMLGWSREDTHLYMPRSFYDDPWILIHKRTVVRCILVRELVDIDMVVTGIAATLICAENVKDARNVDA